MGALESAGSRLDILTVLYKCDLEYLELVEVRPESGVD